MVFIFNRSVLIIQALLGNKYELTGKSRPYKRRSI